VVPGLVQPVCVFQGVAKQEVRQGIVGVDADRLLEVTGGFL
jgi:hypothetical protein